MTTWPRGDVECELHRIGTRDGHRDHCAGRRRRLALATVHLDQPHLQGSAQGGGVEAHLPVFGEEHARFLSARRRALVPPHLAVIGDGHAFSPP
jgi:hypothetical protein